MGALGTNGLKAMLISDSNFSSHFLEHATRLDCTMKSQKIYCNYCNIPKLKKYLFSKSLASSLLN